MSEPVDPTTGQPVPPQEPVQPVDPQQAYPQQAYPQPTYGQQPYSQQAYSQPGYPQQAYPPQTYPGQPGYAAAYGAGGYASAPRTNSMAVVSLISGIAGLTVLFFVGSIVAVITGHIAKRQIGETRESGDGMALAGLVMGYAGLVLGILGGIAVLFWLFAVGAALPIMMTTTG